jgi:hypothetical protein
MRTETVRESALTRTGSPSAHPRPPSGGATDFFLASALSYHQQALRPPGGEDARCVQPISATQTNCVHPHLARSRLLSQLSLRGHPTEAKAPCGSAGGPDVSRRPRTASADRHRHISHLACLRFRDERGRFVPTVPVAIEPLTPLSRNPVHPRASHTFACAALVTTVPSFGGFTAGRRMQSPAKTTLNARP